VKGLVQMSSPVLDLYEGKTVLVTGGQGFVGSAVVQALSNARCNLVVLDQSADSAWIPEGCVAKIKLVVDDIMEKQTWEAVLPGIDYLFHFAAIEYDRLNYDVEKDFRVNALSVFNLLEAAQKSGCRPRVIFSSSANLFGLVDSCPVNEKCHDDPPSPWSVHKLAAENYLRIYSKRYDIRSVTLRLANVYGPAGRVESMSRVVLNRMIKKALAGEELLLYSNQGCLRDFVFSADVADAFLRTACLDDALLDGRFFLVGGGQSMTIGEVWRLVADRTKCRTGRPVQVRVDETVPLEPLDCRDFVADTSAYCAATGWSPLVDLKHGIDITIQSYMPGQ